MARYLLALSVESEFYREYHDQGHGEEELLEQLNGDLQDQIVEFDLADLVKRMLSNEGAFAMPILVDRIEHPVLNV